jgi:hypothetical protein
VKKISGYSNPLITLVLSILIGRHAAIYYGVRRTTGDLDILIEPTKENGAKVMRH